METKVPLFGKTLSELQELVAEYKLPKFTAKQIAKRNHQLSEEIALGDLKDVMVVSVLKGSFVFAADLIRCMHKAGLTPEVEFISIASYGSGTEAGEIKVLRDIDSEGADA